MFEGSNIDLLLGGENGGVVTIVKEVGLYITNPTLGTEQANLQGLSIVKRPNLKLVTDYHEPPSTN